MAETPNIINITPADHNDIEQIVLLTKQLLISHLDYDGEYFQLDVNHRQAITDWVKYHLGAANQFILVARPDAGQPEICGFISGYIKPLFPWFKIKQVGHISFLAVDEIRRKQGVGRQLELNACQWFKNRGITYLELYTNEKNYPGISAWQSYGYKPFNRFLCKKI